MRTHRAQIVFYGGALAMLSLIIFRGVDAMLPTHLATLIAQNSEALAYAPLVALAVDVLRHRRLPVIAAVVALELAWLRTGIFRQAQYWISMAIVFFFQIIIDGWLTKLSAPVVIYDDRQTSDVRFPFDIPVEDFLFGFALVTAVLLLWERQREHQ